MPETCYMCGETDPPEPPAGANVGLCQRHWDRWLDLFVGPFGPAPPCAAHLILEARDDHS